MFRTGDAPSVPSLSVLTLRHPAGIRHLDADVLGAQLRLSYKLANAWPMAPSDRQRAVEIDRMLAELSMCHLRDDAAMFYMAIGMLQPHRVGA